MYRVELEVLKNANKFIILQLFLMYRVELKALTFCRTSSVISKFLMYRVELKGKGFGSSDRLLHTVPNAPCGVESVKLKD